MTRTCCLTLAVFLVAGPGRAGDPETAKEAMTRIQEAAARPAHEGFSDRFASEAFGKVGKDEAGKQRLALAETLRDALITEVRERGDEAIATIKTKADIRNGVARELLLRRDGGAWRIARGRTYVLPGDTGKPARVRLAMRTTNGPYGASAYCFTYVTGDPALCKNRMDLWFCHNGDLHARGESRIAVLGIINPKNVTRLPLGTAWKRTIRARKSRTYVLHCLDRRDRDFFVKFKVTKLWREVVELEWSLLSGGFGAPRDIREAQPLRSNDAADACDGLCGKNG
jgi:hypothetical protein